MSSRKDQEIMTGDAPVLLPWERPLHVRQKCHVGHFGSPKDQATNQQTKAHQP